MTRPSWPPGSDRSSWRKGIQPNSDAGRLPLLRPVARLTCPTKVFTEHLPRPCSSTLHYALDSEEELNPVSLFGLQNYRTMLSLSTWALSLSLGETTVKHLPHWKSYDTNSWSFNSSCDMHWFSSLKISAINACVLNLIKIIYRSYALSWKSIEALSFWWYTQRGFW